MKKSQLRNIIKEEINLRNFLYNNPLLEKEDTKNENEENTFDTLKNQAKTVKGFKDLNGKFKNRDGFSLTFRNGQRTIEFSPSSLKDNVSYTYDYEGNTGSDVISIKNAHKLINNISKK